jgi:hypothetical protein
MLAGVGENLMLANRGSEDMLLPGKERRGLG